MISVRCSRDIVVYCLWMALPFLSASGQTRSVWQIGKFDESPFEFSRNKQDAVTFEAGKSNPEKDWPRRQDTGHPYSILFDLPSPRGIYTLKISALIEQPRIPALHLEINGHTGTFFQRPKVSYSRSDFTYAFDPLDPKVPLTSTYRYRF